VDDTPRTPSAADGSKPVGTVASSTAPALADQLASVWTSLAQVGASLTDDDWARPTACPGWTVADQFAHVVGTESMLLGQDAPPGATEGLAHVRNDIGRVNEGWVQHYRTLGPAAVLRDLADVTARRLDQLRAMDEAAFDAPSWTPIGPGTYRRFMQIRVFDCWVHEQDVREAVGQPGHLQGPAAEQALDEVVRALGFIVGKRAAAPQGSRVRVEVHGPLERTVDVLVDGRAQVVAPDGPPTATISGAADVVLRVACGRRPPLDELAAGRLTVSGDEALARSVVEQLGYTI
jgi:uncharacterized protein (TIGR03083 family)